jgi:hypothetical protein
LTPSWFADIQATALRICRLICLVVIALFVPSVVKAQSFGSAPPPLESGAKWNVGTGLSYGTILGRDAQFWGASLNASHAFGANWGVSSALAYDQETERLSNGSRSKINTFTAIVTPYYRFHRRLTISAGFGKGFIDDDNPHRAMRFTNGDWATGTALSVMLYSRKNISAGFDTSLEYNISQEEWSISWDLGVSWAF